MGKLVWYKRDVRAALEGMAALTPEEKGAYNTVLDLIYLNDGHLVDDDAYISRWVNCGTRTWRRLRQHLIDLGKLVVMDGELHNRRAAAETEAALQALKNLADAGRASAQKRKLNSGSLDEVSAKFGGSLDEVSAKFQRTETPQSSETNGLASTDRGRSARARELDSELERKTPPTLPLETLSEETESGSHVRPNLAIRAKSVGEDSKPKTKARNRAEPNGFAEFYDAYPRHVKRPAAAKKYADALGRATPGEILAGLKRAIIAWKRNGTEPKFVPYPSTWLFNDGWADELEPQPVQLEVRVIDPEAAAAAQKQWAEDAERKRSEAAAWRPSPESQRLIAAAQASFAAAQAIHDTRPNSHINQMLRRVNGGGQNHAH